MLDQRRCKRKLTKAMCPRTAEEKNKMKDAPFRQLVSELQFLAHCTRPDIAHAANSVSSDEAHWRAAKRILRYLKETLNMKLVYWKKTYHR